MAIKVEGLGFKSDGGWCVQVYRDRDGMMGIVDFAYKDDMDYAIRKLDDTEFERGIYVRVREDRGGASPRNRSPLDPCSSAASYLWRRPSLTYRAAYTRNGQHFQTLSWIPNPKPFFNTSTRWLIL